MPCGGEELARRTTFYTRITTGPPKRTPAKRDNSRSQDHKVYKELGDYLRGMQGTVRSTGTKGLGKATPCKRFRHLVPIVHAQHPCHRLSLLPRRMVPGY